MTYRVFTTNGTKCIRKFDNLDDAKSFCWLRDGNGYRIEWQYEGECSPRRFYL